MRNRLNRTAGDEGVIALLVAVLAVVLVGFLAFAADLGNAYATKRALSTAADGAALAAAQELAGRGLLCAVPAAPALLALDVARDYSSVRNAPGSALRPGASGFSLGCDATDGAGLVSVGNTETVPFVFGGVLGVGSAVTNGDATAKFGAAGTATGLRPFGLCGLTAQFVALSSQSGLDPGLRTPIRFPVEKTKPAGGPDTAPIDVTSDCGGAAGNWGLLDLDQGSDGNNVSNGTPDLRSWITDGYQDELDLADETIFGNPGSPGSGKFQSEAQSIVGKTILLPVYDKLVPATVGANAQFHITGFVSAVFCNYKFGNNSGSPRAPCASATGVGKPVDPDFIELLFKESLTVGAFKDCSAAGDGCKTSGAYTISLVK